MGEFDLNRGWCIRIFMEEATFAAGCFWGPEMEFRRVTGVVETEVGYTGGRMENPSYSQVCSGLTGHAEAVHVTFDPEVVSYEELLNLFFAIHNAAVEHKAQYRSAIFFHTPEQEEAAVARRALEPGAVTEIVPAGPFYRAEEYHQRYYEK